MKNLECRNCDYQKNTKYGNCIKVKENDLVVRCAPFWTERKHKLIEYYSGTLTEGMKKYWKQINYIDLFAGPGKYFDRSTGEIQDGSPIIAADFKYDNLFLVDLNSENIEALKNRLKDVNKNISYYIGDANDVVIEINKRLPYDSLSFCFIDPNNMGEFKYESLRNLTQSGKRIDILINFAYGMDFRRGSSLTKTKYSDFFGTDDWIKISEKYADTELNFAAKELIDLFMNQLLKIGYILPPEFSSNKNIFNVYNSKKTLLYYLIFASRHERGYDFCRKTRRYVDPQQELL